MENSDLAYKKIEKYIERLIDDGGLKEGDRLFSERKLAAMFAVSSDSARKGMRKFIDNGILEKKHGQGTFVKRTLRKKNATNRIGVIFPHSLAGFFASSFYSGIMSGLAEEAHRHHKDIIIRSFVEADISGFSGMLTDMERDVDGFIVVDLIPYILDAIRDTLPVLTRPMVMLNYEGAPGTVDAVVTDSRENTRRLVQYAVDGGHRDILFLHHHEMDIHPNFDNRIKAAMEALGDNGIEAKESMFSECNGRGADLKPYFDGKERPTAVICLGTNIVFQHLYPLLKKMKLRVPEDVSVLAYDNVSECESVSPAITGIDTRMSEIGRQGIRLLAERIAEPGANRDNGHHRVVLSGEICERESFRALAPAN